MDDFLEEPSAIPAPSLPSENAHDEEEQSSGDEDGGPDWTKLPSALNRPVIPKRGEKEFEPSSAGGSGLQQHVLDRARSAMFDALRATRTTSSKSISYGIWYPDLARVSVTVARGIHFTAMGHSVPRPIHTNEGIEKTQKRLEILPEEAIYLVERGAMFCWKESSVATSGTPIDGIGGSPMSVEQAFAEMIGTEDLTLEKYQVFSYLKRLGYAVTRANPPTPSYPIPPPLLTRKSSSYFAKFLSFFPRWFSRISMLFKRKMDWWQPVRFGNWLYHDKSYGSLFTSLRFLPSGHRIPLKASDANLPSSPYKIFYNLYKPSTPFRKTAPPPPDFSVVVVNARTTPMPSLQELASLFDVLPEIPPPLPRQRRPIQDPGASGKSLPTPTPKVELPWHRKLFSWAWPAAAAPAQPPPRKPHPFMALKAGKKTIVVAVVDSGSVGFFRFGEGAFAEWPMA